MNIWFHSFFNYWWIYLNNNINCHMISTTCWKSCQWALRLFWIGILDNQSHMSQPLMYMAWSDLGVRLLFRGGRVSHPVIQAYGMYWMDVWVQNTQASQVKIVNSRKKYSLLWSEVGEGESVCWGVTPSHKPWSPSPSTCATTSAMTMQLSTTTSKTTKAATKTITTNIAKGTRDPRHWVLEPEGSTSFDILVKLQQLARST